MKTPPFPQHGLFMGIAKHDPGLHDIYAGLLFYYITFACKILGKVNYFSITWEESGAGYMLEQLGNFVWGGGMLTLILGTGVFLLFRTGFLPWRLGLVLKRTLVTLFKKDVRKSGEKQSISQFQAMSTALAATMGTGNIAGVATALTLGGPGSIFWMWISGLIGMGTVYGENVLGIRYRRRNAKGEWVGGPMVTLEKGLHCRWLGLVYAALCVLASLGIGNMAQVNSISTSLDAVWSISPQTVGVVTAAVTGIIILGGIKRVGSVAEKLIPVLSIGYILGALYIIIKNRAALPAAFLSIFQSALGLNAAAGGITGAMVKSAVSAGLRRGVFSNEAGLGSSVMVHAASDVKEPVQQGLWAVFEVFLDTILCCTLTALAVLSTGVLEKTSADGAPLVIEAFASGFGDWAGIFISVCVILFAFATLLGWSVYGGKACEYLLGEKSVKYYQLLFIVFVYIGSQLKLESVWQICDILNGLMAIPNLIGVILLSGVIAQCTKEYKQTIKQQLV